MSRRVIGLVDTMWLRMDRPENLMTIDGVMWTEQPVDWDRYVRVLQRRLVGHYPVFSQRPVVPVPVGQPFWEDDPNFDITRHIVRARLPDPGGEHELQRYIEEQATRPFDRRHPLWEVHFVDGFGSGSAIVSRFHHSLADGMALANVMLSLTDATDDGDLKVIDEVIPAGLRHPLDGVPLVGSAARTVEQVVRFAMTTSASVAGKLPALLTPAGVAGAASLSWKTVKIARKLLLHTEPKSPLHGPIGITKRTVWSRPWGVADIKRVGRATGTSVNDILVSALAGAIHRYTVDLGGSPVDLMTMIPVNLRPPDRPLPRELGNKFALVMLSLPTALSDRDQRLAETKRRMDEIKNSPEAILTFGINQALGVTTSMVEKFLVNFFANKTFGVTTNVIGPTQQRYIAGVPLIGALGWVPGSGNHTLGTCIFSYAGAVRVGFKADAIAIPNPEKLVHYFDDELDALLPLAPAPHESADRERVPRAHRQRKPNSRGRRASGGRTQTDS